MFKVDRHDQSLFLFLEFGTMHRKKVDACYHFEGVNEDYLSKNYPLFVFSVICLSL